MKVPLLILGILIGLACAGLINYKYRQYFVNQLKKESPELQAKYLANRIQSLKETYQGRVETNPGENLALCWR
ncbi:hypothetical protein ES703_114259 [subsurface metagenome]